MADLLKHTSASTGAGNMVLRFLPRQKSLFDAYGRGGDAMFLYSITHPDTGEWEQGAGHLRDAATLVRDYVIASSNNGMPVHFSDGEKIIRNENA
jgi:hypothetical protein